MFYNARWYDVYLNRFAQADSIVPGGVQGLDRYAYVRNSPLNYTDPSGHYEACEDEKGWRCLNEKPGNTLRPGGQCNIATGYCRTPPPKKGGSLRSIPAPAGLTDKGRDIFNYYVYLKSYDLYYDLTPMQFLGLMMMYEINGLADAQKWDVISAVDQLFSPNHGIDIDAENPYCPSGPPCDAAVFNYMGAYLGSAMAHATSHNDAPPLLLPTDSTGNLLGDAQKIGQDIFNLGKFETQFDGIHWGNNPDWLTVARNRGIKTNDPYVKNGYLAMNGSYVAYSVTQENFWICVMAKGYAEC